MKLSPDRLREDPVQNARGGAAFLASKARQLGSGKLPTQLGDWYAAVAAYSGAADQATAAAFTDDVYQTLGRNTERITLDGQRVHLSATPKVAPHRSKLLALKLSHPEGKTPAAECPEKNCRFIPAIYQQTPPTGPDGKPAAPGPGDYCCHDTADRPKDGNRIRYIIIHDAEGTYDGTILWLQNPKSANSSHYVIRSSDGQITQMLPTKDVAWHSANANINRQSIGIEHEGYAAEGATWYTEAMYRSSAKLVRYLAKKYGIPLDRNHILGHEDITRNVENGIAGAHWDPGGFWDWDHYMALVRGDADESHTVGHVNQGVVAIRPDFAKNVQATRDCPSGKRDKPCRDLPAKPTNFLYLRTEPRDDAPYLNDPYLQPDGSAGTNKISDWSDKAVAGRRYVVAQRRGQWLAIWYGGKKAWLKDPGGNLTTPVTNLVVRPRANKGSIPVYRVAFPRPGEYPNGVPIDSKPDEVTPTQYTIFAGQAYPLTETTPAAYYYARYDGAHVPRNHTLIAGKDLYYLISYNHRLVYVKASDVQLGQ
ncbi:MAG: N-acetylmuramoyl-L-alanine amidase [Mycobacteriales bacterium]